MAPDRYQITKVKKQSNESFREYAQRWRRLAAQVIPSMTESEMVMTFIDIQEAHFYERVLASIDKPFSEMIKHGEMAKMGLKSGKIQDLAALKVVAEHIQSENYGNNPRKVHKKKEEDGNNQNMPIQRRNYTPFQAQSSNPPVSKGEEVKRPRVFTPLGDSLENILTLLTTQKKITHLLPPASPNGRVLMLLENVFIMSGHLDMILKIVGP